MIENFGRNVARLRKESDLSQEELANKIGLNKQTISNIERGIRYPTFETLEKIAQVFDVSSIQLFGTEKEIEIDYTGYVMDRMDEYEGKMQNMLRFAKIYDEKYLEKIDESYEKIKFIETLVGHRPMLSDDETEPLLDNNNNPLHHKSVIDLLPYKKIDDVYNKLKYIEKNKNLN